MTENQTCALPGCSKPRYLSLGRAEPHLTCGRMHHQLLMAARFHPSRHHPHPHQQLFERKAAGLCALPACSDPPHPDHSWCSRSHYKDWLMDFSSHLHPDQICRLPGCGRHVFVEENSSPWQFCGWRHCQKFVMLSAQQQRLHQIFPLQKDLSSPSNSVESKQGHVPSLESLLCSLREYALTAKPPKNIKVEEDFFNKHPWNVCTEGHTCWLIVRCKYKKGKRVMLTKDDYHWKQQGRPISKNQSDFTLKYFTYKKRKGKQNDVVDYPNGCTYFMEEYMVEDEQDFALVKLRKSTTANGKQHKGRPATRGKRSVAAANDACSQNTTLSIEAVENFFGNLSPLPHGLDAILDSSVYTGDW